MNLLSAHNPEWACQKGLSCKRIYYYLYFTYKGTEVHDLSQPCSLNCKPIPTAGEIHELTVEAGVPDFPQSKEAQPQNWVRTHASQLSAAAPTPGHC